MREEAEEERSLFIARSDDGLGDGQHGSGQNLQAEASGAEPSGGLDRQAGAGLLSSHLGMSSESVRTWFLVQAADLCRKPPSLTSGSECRTSDWTPATHTCLSFARSESVKATETHSR